MNRYTTKSIKPLPCFLLSLYTLSFWALQAFADDKGPNIEKISPDQALVENFPTNMITPEAMEGREPTLPFHGSVETYKKTIIAIENEYGVYDSRLSEQLMGLGLAYQNQGEHKSAIGSFKRAAHINRINHGLYSLSQGPMLRHLVESYSADNDWKNANDKQQLLYELERRNYGDDNPKLLATLSEMVEWHLDAFQRGSNITHLLRAWELNQHAISIIETNFGPDDLQLDDALVRQVSTSYHLAEYQMSISAPTNYFNPSQKTTTSLTQPNIPEQDQRFHSMLSPYRDGKTALLRRVELYKKNPQGTSNDQAEALVKLGDWYFYFNKRESAIKTYQEAEKILATTDNSGERIERVFGKPHPLIFDADRFQSEERDKQKQQGYVEAKFDITPGGRARDVRILESEPPDMMDSLVQQSIKATRYRPRIIDGKPVLTKGVIYRHIFDF
ncbi:MAG: energy transducer TonB [Pseudomonadales bacterium]|nr:energy transducer TonB [Pseudomonadales bacterium]